MRVDFPKMEVEMAEVKKNGEGAFQRLVELFKASEDRLLPFDFGVLQVAMMIAAVDGEVKADEVAAFKRLARKCRGWTGPAAVKALSAALHAAGYIVVESRLVKERALLAAFVREARALLPRDFVKTPVANIRRAFVMWLLMTWADRRASIVERKAILALRKSLGLEKVVTDRFIREVEKDILLLADARTVPEGTTMLGAFVDLA